MKEKLIYGLLAILVILGCGGAGSPYVPDIDIITTSGNFSVLGSGTQTINQGQTANFNMQIMLGQMQYAPDRSPTPVNLSVSGLPNDSSATFSANPVVPTDPATDVTLTVATQVTTTPGSYTLTVTGNDGALTQTTNFTLVVNPINANFQLQLETTDGAMTNEPEIGGKALIPDDTSAQYLVTVIPPTNYTGQVRIEYRFTGTGAPTLDDIGTEFRQTSGSNNETFTFNITAGTTPETTEANMTRLRFPIPRGHHAIEFKVVPLVTGFNSATVTGDLNVIENNVGTRRGG